MPRTPAPIDRWLDRQDAKTGPQPRVWLFLGICVSLSTVLRLVSVLVGTTNWLGWLTLILMAFLVPVSWLQYRRHSALDRAMRRG